MGWGGLVGWWGGVGWDGVGCGGVRVDRGGVGRVG